MHDIWIRKQKLQMVSITVDKNVKKNQGICRANILN
jgi:hypothetical protein